jgi:hypothetical protein
MAGGTSKIKIQVGGSFASYPGSLLLLLLLLLGGEIGIQGK